MKKFEHKFTVTIESDDDRSTCHEALIALVDVGLADATESLDDPHNESPLAKVLTDADIRVEE